jgi:ribonuclease HII
LLKPFYQNSVLEAGTDEAGRGCLAGPVVAAAVILPAHYRNNLLNDSKQLPQALRLQLKAEIEQAALSFAVAFVEPCQIDTLNILNASILAMHRALAQLCPAPELILVDGNRFKPYKNIKHQCIVKGDAKYMSIAAASVLAKTYRDEYMIKLHEEFPQYGWLYNKGYPTVSHRQAIARWGISKYHRKSFNLLQGNEQLCLF